MERTCIEWSTNKGCHIVKKGLSSAVRILGPVIFYISIILRVVWGAVVERGSNRDGDEKEELVEETRFQLLNTEQLSPICLELESSYITVSGHHFHKKCVLLAVVK